MRVSRLWALVSLVAVATLVSINSIPYAFASSPPASSSVTKEVVMTCLSGYVSSPLGCVSIDCVFGHVRFVDLKTGKGTFDNGTDIVAPAHCLTVPAVAEVVTSSDGIASSAVSPMVSPTGSSFNPSFTGWIEDAKFAQCSWFSCAQFSSFSGQWSVPPAPTVNDGQSVYLWIGMENYWRNQLIQPVLQWGPSSCTGGGPYWYIASYGVGGSTYCSSLKQVNPGDTITGSMFQYTCGYCCGCWGIDTKDTTTGADSGLTVQADNMNNAFVTLEVHAVGQCADFPQTYPGAGYMQTDFTNLQVAGGTPGWGAEYSSGGGGCVRSVNIYSSSHVGLYYY